MDIIKQNRKTIKLMLTDEGDIKVYAPKFTSQTTIKKFIESKDNWIQKKRKKIEEFKSPCFKTFQDGDNCLYMGKLFNLKVLAGKVNNISIQDEELVLRKKNDQLTTKEILIKCYKAIAKDILPDRVFIHAKNMSLTYNQIRIKNSKTRWGSCSSKNNINLNWALIMAPMSVIDYVVIHELCHLREMNHSKQFWALVNQYDPNYKLHMKWLKDHQQWLKI